MTAAIQPRRMHASVDTEGRIHDIVDETTGRGVFADHWMPNTRVAPVMVISIAEYMRLKAAATRKGRK